MSIKYKILLPIIAIALVTTVVLVVVSIAIFSGYVDQSISDEIEVFSSVAYDQYEGLFGIAQVGTKLVASDEDFRNAVAAGDRESILLHAQALSGEAGIDFFTVVDTKGIVLARIHNPGSYGDDLSAQNTFAEALQGRTMVSVEQGSEVKLSVRAGQPVYDANGTLVGAVSGGCRLDTMDFVDGIKAVTGSEVTVFLGDTRLSTTVVNAQGARVTGTAASEAVSRQVLGGGEYVGQADVVGRQAFVKYVPLRAKDNSVIGMLFVGLYTEAQTTAVTNFVWQSVIVALIILVVAIPFAIILARRIIKPIRAMVVAAQKLATGDVDVNIEVNTKDEMKALANAFNQMTGHTRAQAEAISRVADGDLTVNLEVASEKDVIGHALNTMIEKNNHVFAQINAAAERVAAEAHMISGGAQALAQGSTEQAAVVAQLSESFAGVSGKARNNADMADEAALLGNSIKESAQQGSEKMTRMTKAVSEINEASRSISNVIKIIEDIAFQTNILALNAAVEAARAGHAGKGFAVVAEEVRTLAGRSAEAAQNTSALISNSMEKAELGAQIAVEAESSFAEIFSGINKSSGIVSQIAEVSQEQCAAIDSVNEGMDQVAQVVQQNSATSEESAAASDQMSLQADVLKGLASQFKLR